MKWIAFGLFAIVAVPGMFAMATSHARWRAVLFAVMLASTAVGIDINFCSMENYRGPDRGFQIGLTDLIALSLGAALIAIKPKRINWVPANTIPMAAYFAVTCIATIVSPLLLVSLFTLFKIAKGYLIYWCAYNYCRVETPFQPLWWGLVSICSVETILVLKQKYLEGLYRVHGTFDHSNTIPAYLLLIIPLLLAWTLVANHWPRTKAIATVIAMLGACACIVGSLSRAGVAMTGFSVIAVVGANLFRGVSFRGAAISGTLFVLLVAGGLKSADTLVQRFKEAPESSGEARDEFNYAADLMTQDNVFGVGLNSFSHVLTVTPKYNSHVSVMGSEEHAGVCHHIYRLTSAETGRIGLACFIVVLLRFAGIYVVALFGRPTIERAIAFATLVGSFNLHVIGLLEWVFRVTPVFHLFLIVSAVGVAMAERARQNTQQQRSNQKTTPANRAARRLR